MGGKHHGSPSFPLACGADEKCPPFRNIFLCSPWFFFFFFSFVSISEKARNVLKGTTRITTGTLGHAASEKAFLKEIYWFSCFPVSCVCLLSSFIRPLSMLNAAVLELVAL